MNRTCAVCCSELIGRTARARYCSNTCKARAASDREVAANAEKRATACAHCAGSMEGKRPHAVYCSRSCKSMAGTKRRIEREPDYDQQRYVKEAPRRKAYARQYLAARPGYAAAQRVRRKARKRAVPNYRFSRADWLRLLVQYRWSCAYCGIKNVPLQREHVIPLAKGGSHGVGNIVPACAPCNYGKRTRFAIEWKLRLRREGVIAR